MVVTGAPEGSIMHARTLVIALLVSVVAGCAGEEDAELTQIGARVVPVKGTRVETAPVDWTVARGRLEELGLTGAASVLEFAPGEGLHRFTQQLLRLDACGIADGSSEVDHDIQQVNARAATYRNSLVVHGERAPGLEVNCELSDRMYRCAGSATTIDFQDVGLAATVTIQNDGFGIWSGSSPAFVGSFPYTLSCEGADCDKSPASDLFGLITRPMPCTGVEAARLEK